MDQELLSVKDFALFAGLHYNTVRRAILSGRIQATNYGQGKRKFYRIHKSEFQRLALFDIRQIMKKGEEK